MLKTALLALGLAFAVISSHTLLQANMHDQLAHELRHGNDKFVKNHHYKKERKKLAHGQNPPFIFLCCSDSRVPPELVFDQGLGELFVARVAGQVVDDVVVDSIEYASRHFDVEQIVVMGHSKCGAVIGALERLRENDGQIDPVNGHLNAVLIPIEKAIVAAGINIYASDALEKSIDANIRYQAKQLVEQSEHIAHRIQKGELKIIGIEYDLKSGKVKQKIVLGG
jgi:carbonic anhydrase